MKTSRALTPTDAGRDDVRGGEVDNVLHGAFDASYSIKDLAAELGVSVQTLYDLRTQARGSIGFRSVAVCDSGAPRSTPGWPGSRKRTPIDTGAMRDARLPTRGDRRSR
jgi:hypothetical protein